MKEISEELSNQINSLDALLSSFDSMFETINLEVTQLISDIENEDITDSRALSSLISQSIQSAVSIVQNLNKLSSTIKEL